MEHLAVLADAGSAIQADDLPVRCDTAAPSAAARGWPAQIMAKAYHPAKEAVLAQFEKEYLASLVARAERNMSKAARLAGIDRTTLYRLLEKHDVAGGGESKNGEISVPYMPPAEAPPRVTQAD
jgi:DNA-binding NtrC family response regulator